MPKAVSVMGSKALLTGMFGTALAAALMMGSQAYGQAAGAGKLATRAGTASRTELTVNTDEQGSRTKATFTVHVAAADRGSIPTGTVTVMLGNASIGSAVLDANGDATTTADALPRGTNLIHAVYNGDATFAASATPETKLQSEANGVPDFTLSANPTSLSLTAGDYGTTVISVTPEDGFDDAVTLSCTGQPAATVCTFSPVSVTPDGTKAGQSTLNIQTRAASSSSLAPLPGHGNRLAYALLLPVGGLLLLGVQRKSRGLRLLAMAGLLLAVGGGLTSCAARYDYLHHPPIPNPGTPAGTYKITLNAFSNNGSSVTSHSLKYITLTVK